MPYAADAESLDDMRGGARSDTRSESACSEMEKSFMWKSIILTSCVLAAMIPARAVDLNALDGRLSELAKWEYDQSREGARAITEIVVSAKGSPADIRQIEARLDRFLERDATLGGKDFVCKQLSLIGSAASVPVLSRLLIAPDTAEIARYALERIPGPEVDRALREALPKTSGRAQIGIINSSAPRDAIRIRSASCNPSRWGPIRLQPCRHSSRLRRSRMRPQSPSWIRRKRTALRN